MKSINQVTLLGNLTRDPELRYTPSGAAVISFSVATSREWKDKETQEKKEITDYHNVIFWNKAAEILSQFVFKGHKILVQGRLQTRSWEGKDGNKRYATEIVGDDFVLLTPKKDVDVAKKEKAEVDVKVKAFDEDKEKEKATESVQPDDIPF
jgi:single-strand DNA-binding protein